MIMKGGERREVVEFGVEVFGLGFDFRGLLRLKGWIFHYFWFFSVKKYVYSLLVI